MARGTGTTTQQLKAAPQGAHFIWCNDNISYVRLLAVALHREDLHLHSIKVLDTPRLRGIDPRHILLDHAAQLTGPQQAEWEALNRRLSLPVKSFAEAVSFTLEHGWQVGETNLTMITELKRQIEFLESLERGE